MISLIPIPAKCPTCGSADVFYSCHVSCCFNHVCNACRTTFELATRFLGYKEEQALERAADRDTSLPMAPCAECGKSNVYAVEEREELACTDCRAVLALEYEKIRPDT